MVAATLEPNSQTVKYAPDARDRQRLEPFTSCPDSLQLPATTRLIELFGCARDQVLKLFFSFIVAFVLRGKKRAYVRARI